MGDCKLVQIDSFFDSLAAQQAKNCLDHEGIPAFVEGANTNSAFYIGSALAGVKLLVARQDQERARSVLQQYHLGPNGTTWYCGDCDEFNEPSFDLCWSCGKNREDVEQPAPIKTTQRQSEIIDDELNGPNIPQRIESGNPYQPPLIMLPADRNRETQLDFEQTEESEKTEEVIQRAWRASILGLLLPIPIFHVYSVILLLGVDQHLPISRKSKRQLKLAWTINIALVLLICIAILAIALQFSQFGPL